MLVLSEMLLLLITLSLFGFMLYEYVKGKGDLISARNVAILGFIVFQSFSGFLWIFDGKYQLGYFVPDPGKAAFEFTLACAVFLLIALTTYAKTPAAGLGSRLAPTSKVLPSDATMILFCVALLGVAVFMRFAVMIPYVNILGNILGISLCGVAAGIGGWLIGRHTFNPVYLVVAGFIILASLAIPMTGAYGRRAIVSAALGVAWGLYYARFRYERPARTLGITAIAMVPMMITFALFSSVRGGVARRGSVTEIANTMMSQGSLVRGLRDLDGQGTGGVSMWLMQSIGSEGVRGSDPLATFLYMIWYPAPRAMFPMKPNPLTMQIPDLANLQDVAPGLNIGPGIIGHAFADGGWVVLIFYALFAGWLIRNIDEIVRRNPYAPFVVLPIGSTLGELLGAARGESGYMMFQFLFGTAGSFVFIVLIGKLLESLGYAQVGPPEGTDELSDASAEDGGDYESGDEHGYDDPYGDSYGPDWDDGSGDGTPGSTRSAITPR